MKASTKQGTVSGHLFFVETDTKKLGENELSRKKTTPTRSKLPSLNLQLFEAPAVASDSLSVALQW